MRLYKTIISLICFNLFNQAMAQSPDDELVKWGAAYTGEGASNVDGGQREGSAYAGQLYVGADVNLDNAFGWTSTTLHLAAINRHGNNLAKKHLGNSTSVQEIYGGQGSRLVLFSVEKHLLDNKLELEAGRMVANINFLGSDLCQYFQNNAACGNPTFVFRTSSFTWWPVSSWGARSKYWFTPNVYAHIGVYEDNSGHQDDSDHGLIWNTNESNGFIVPFTLGYRTTWDTARYPRTYEFGGWYDKTDYSDPLKDSDGNNAVETGNPYAPLNGRSGIFARFEQVVYRPDPDSKRSLTLFGAALTRSSGELAVDYQLQGGFVQRGTFSGRDDDTVGFVVSQQNYSSEALEDLRLARALNGGSGTPSSNQVMMELSYGYQLTPAIRVQPNLQYIINPDQFAEPGRKNDLDNIFIIGLRFDVNLADMIK
jgi:porin